MNHLPANFHLDRINHSQVIVGQTYKHTNANLLFYIESSELGESSALK